MSGDAGKVPTIKRLLESGEYRVDPYATADAILRRRRLWREVDLLGRPTPRLGCRDAQSECSYPDSSRPLSMKATPTGPALAHPIMVSSASAVGDV